MRKRREKLEPRYSERVFRGLEERGADFAAPAPRARMSRTSFNRDLDERRKEPKCVDSKQLVDARIDRIPVDAESAICDRRVKEHEIKNLHAAKSRKEVACR